jgi:hypothetical protein
VTLVPNSFRLKIPALNWEKSVTFAIVNCDARGYLLKGRSKIMEAIIEDILNFSVRQEKMLLTICEQTEEKKLGIGAEKTFKNLVRLSEKNIKLFEKSLVDLPEKIRTISIRTVILNDFELEIPTTSALTEQYKLLWIMKALDNFIRLWSKVLAGCDDHHLRKTIEIQIEEKQNIRRHVESSYDQAILK